MNATRLRSRSSAIALSTSLAVFVACGGGDDPASTDDAGESAGASGASASSGAGGKATAGSAGTTSKGGSAGTGGAGKGGTGGSGGTSGSGGKAGAGASGTSGGKGGAGGAGAGGATAGAGGATAGAAGTSAGSGGTANGGKGGAGGTASGGKGGTASGGKGGTGGAANGGAAGSGTAGSGTAGSGTAGSGTAGSGTAGSGTAGSAGTTSANACPPLTIDHGASVGGYLSDDVRWRDSACQPRRAVMVRNDGKDPSGHYGGYLRRFEYETPGGTRACEGSSTTHPGWGYTINHFGNTSSGSYGFKGTYQTVLEGRHHAIHRYQVKQSIDGHLVDVTLEWLFTTGVDHPVWAVTFDASSAPANSIKADTRAPYGDLQWDGGAGASVAGVGWGDHYKFTSKGSPATLQNAWDYSVPNKVPYVIEWTTSPDAEMGSVQTQTYEQHDAGGYWFYDQWGKSSNGPMPQDWNWTYQLNQYEMPFLDTSKRLAWGANYGAVGQTAYDAYGDQKKLSGYPFQSYSVHVVLGLHTAGAVAGRVAEVEALVGAALSATKGTVRTKGPAGVGRSDEATYDPPGYDPIRGAFHLDAAADGASFTLTLPAQATSPTFVVHGYDGTSPLTVTVAGAQAEADVGYYASSDPSGALWLTIPGAHTGALPVTVAW